MKKNILVLLGPNLNMVGVREKEIYGEDSYKNINLEITEYANKLGLSCEIFQSNWEGALIDKIHECSNFDAVIVNAGALSHYSYALRDAIACVKTPFVEVHMSNIYKREEFRSKSVIADVCVGSISGFGKRSYILAIDAVKDLI